MIFASLTGVLWLGVSVWGRPRIESGSILQEAALFLLPSNATSIREDIVTVFSCSQRPYGYYADPNNDCQLFHVCMPVHYVDGQDRMFMWSFICPEETMFNQETFTCARPEDSVACQDSPLFYSLNDKFGQLHVKVGNNSAAESEEQLTNLPTSLRTLTRLPSDNVSPASLPPARFPADRDAARIPARFPADSDSARLPTASRAPARHSSVFIPASSEELARPPTVSHSPVRRTPTRFAAVGGAVSRHPTPSHSPASLISARLKSEKPPTSITPTPPVPSTSQPTATHPLVRLPPAMQPPTSLTPDSLTTASHASASHMSAHFTTTSHPPSGLTITRLESLTPRASYKSVAVSSSSRPSATYQSFRIPSAIHPTASHPSTPLPASRHPTTSLISVSQLLSSLPQFSPPPARTSSHAPILQTSSASISIHASSTSTAESPESSNEV